jgi:hypothetical protein
VTPAARLRRHAASDAVTPIVETFAAAIVTAAHESEATEKTIYVDADDYTSTIPL